MNRTSIDKSIDIIYDRIVGNVAKIMGIAMTCTILIQIFSRSFMNVPFSWTEEFSRITFMWFCFLGSGIAMKRKAHLGIDYFVTKMGPKFRYVNLIVVYALVGVFSLFLIVYGTRITSIMHKQESSVMRIPLSYFYAVVPVTGVLFLIPAVYHLWADALRGRSGRRCPLRRRR